MKSDIEIAAKYINLFNSAKERKIEFSLSLKSLTKLYKTTKCFYTNKPLTLETMSIDRIDNTKGYVENNVVACNKAFNHLKGSLTPDDIKILYTKLHRLKIIK